MSPFPETTAEWCLLLAAPGAPVIRIDANNEGRGTCSLDEALASGGTFGVIIRDDVVAVDVDDDRDWVLPALLEHLAECGQEYLVFSSGRPGHFHLLLVCWSDSHALSAARGLRIFLDTMGRPDVGVRHRQHLRPPGAPHRLGLPTSCAPVAWTAGALPQLQSARPMPWRSQAAPEEPRSSKEPSAKDIEASSTVVSEPTSRERGSLDRHTYALLVHNEARNKYPSRSEVVYALLRGMYRAGWSESEAHRALSDPANRGGEAWRSIRRGEPRRDGTVRKRPRKWLHIVWKAAARHEDARPRRCRTPDEMVDGERAVWLAFVNTSVLATSPRRVGSIMLVAAYLASIADPDELTCRGSLRLIGERCALDPGTVQTALKDLGAGSFLEALEVGAVEANGSGLGQTTPSSWRLVTVSDMGGTTPVGTIPPVPTRAGLPEGYGDVDASVSASARWLLLHLVDRELTVTECAALVGITERSVLLAQKDRRGGPLHQLLTVGLVRKNARGTYVARLQPTKKAVAAATRVEFHGRRAVDRRRRMQVRHDRQRQQAVSRINELKGERTRARIDEYYRARRGLRTALAATIADATIRARQVNPQRERPVPQSRVHEVRNDNKTTRRYTVGADEVVVAVGDSVISNRARRAGARMISAYRFSPFAPHDYAWRTEGRIVNASRLAEAVRDLPDLPVRLRQVLPDPGDLAAVMTELEPVLSPYQKMTAAAA